MAQCHTVIEACFPANVCQSARWTTASTPKTFCHRVSKRPPFSPIALIHQQNRPTHQPGNRCGAAVLRMRLTLSNHVHRNAQRRCWHHVKQGSGATPHSKHTVSRLRRNKTPNRPRVVAPTCTPKTAAKANPLVTMCWLAWP